MRFRCSLVALAVSAALLGAPRPASATMEGVSASELFAQHAYLRTDDGIYYATMGGVGITLKYVPSSDLAALLQVLLTGLKPYSPGPAAPAGDPMDFGPYGAGGGGDGGNLSPATAFGGAGPAPPGAAGEDLAATDSPLAPTTPPPSVVAIVPAPEPASLALILGGVTGLLLLEGSRRRRRRPAK